MQLAWLVVVVLCACKGGSSAHEEAPPPPPVPPYPLVGKTDAVVPIAKAPRPNHVVWIGATGGLELGQPDKVWTGALPKTRAPVANLDTLVATVIPPPEPEPEPGTNVGLARERAFERTRPNDDPWAAKRIDVIPVPGRGFERAFASVGARMPDETVPIVLASPAAPAATVVKVVTKVGAQLGVAQRGDQLAVLRLSFRPAVQGYVLDDTRERWIELHVGADQIDALSLPSNGRALVPWKKATVDADALRSVYKGLGKEPPKLDVFVDQAVTYQRLVDTLVALDELGVTVIGLGESPGAIDKRLDQVIALRAARASYTSATAVLEVGRINSQGDLDKREILRVMRTKLADLTACYEPELAKQPELQGEVMMQFFIAPQGKIVQAGARGLGEVGPCVAKKLEGLQFPLPKGGGGVQVNFQVVFRPKGT